MVKVKLSSARCSPLTLIQDTVEAFLTDNLHTTMRLGIGRVLAEGGDNLLTYCWLAQHQQQQLFYSQTTTEVMQLSSRGTSGWRL